MLQRIASSNALESRQAIAGTPGKMHTLVNEIDRPDAVVVCGSGQFVTAWEQQIGHTFPDTVILDQQHQQRGHFVDAM
ncbi:hypothetical protein QYH69_04145 [Paraburkholderia sp. SARCC-3016]|nr:hypothetical protein [Paraburkholderia sp. SARCC-3016]